MSKFKELSHTAGVSVDTQTGEFTELDLGGVKSSVGERVGKYISPSYPQSAIDSARFTTSTFAENLLCSVFNGKKARAKNAAGHDIVLPDGRKLESKVGRIGNSAVIKKRQLGHMDDDGLYGLVYYRTTGNKPPSFFTSQKLGISPEAYLKRNISVESVFILPKRHIIYYYNRNIVLEGNISTTNVRHKALSHRNAVGIYEENHDGDKEDGDKKIETDGLFGRHTFPIYSLGYQV